jgi:ribosomal protein S19E (S16A)
MANKITEREIYTSIINGTADQAVLTEFATKKLAQLDKRNASAKRRANAKREAGNEITKGIFGVLTNEAMTREQVAEAYGSDLSVAKVGARLNQLVEAGRVQKVTVKVAGKDGKATNKVAYFVAE